MPSYCLISLCLVNGEVDGKMQTDYHTFCFLCTLFRYKIKCYQCIKCVICRQQLMSKFILLSYKFLLLVLNVFSNSLQCIVGLNWVNASKSIFVLSCYLHLKYPMAILFSNSILFFFIPSSGFLNVGSLL